MIKKLLKINVEMEDRTPIFKGKINFEDLPNLLERIKKKVG